MSNNVSHLYIKLKEEEDPNADTDSRAAAFSLSAHPQLRVEIQQYKYLLNMAYGRSGKQGSKQAMYKDAKKFTEKGWDKRHTRCDNKMVNKEEHTDLKT